MDRHLWALVASNLTLWLAAIVNSYLAHHDGDGYSQMLGLVLYAAISSILLRKSYLRGHEKAMGAIVRATKAIESGNEQLKELVK